MSHTHATQAKMSHTHVTHVSAEISHTHMTHVSAEMSHTHVTRVSAEMSHTYTWRQDRWIYKEGISSELEEMFYLWNFPYHTKTLYTRDLISILNLLYILT